MAPILIFATNLGAVVGFLILIWILSLILKDSSIVDITWGLGFILIAWLTFWQSNGAGEQSLLLPILVTVWGLRLALHIGIRNIGEGEDFRYQAIRRKWGDKYWWGSLLQVFLLQALLCWVVSLSIQAGQMSLQSSQPTWLTWAGLGVWAFGFFFEVVSDWQLTRFRIDPDNKGEVMNRGLWRYSRHPNYFGEAVLWWGLFLIVLEDLSTIWSIISPILITFLLLKVSGVTMLERTITRRRPGYAQYIEQTNAFIPWFPKKLTE